MTSRRDLEIDIHSSELSAGSTGLGSLREEGHDANRVHGGQYLSDKIPPTIPAARSHKLSG